MKNIIPPILVLILFLAIWAIGARIYDMIFLLPGPMLVAEAFVTDIDMVIEGAKITLQEAFTGFILAIVIGITVATIMSLSKILYSQKKASENTFFKKNIPFRSFEVKKRDEKTLGELFSFFILETILLGKALKLNPYDQPAVELIKKETKKILT